MMRLVALAALLGALTAGVSWYAMTASMPKATTVAQSGAAGETMPADLPICTTMTGLGTEVEWAQLDPDFAAGKRALAVEHWQDAIRSLNLAGVRDPASADIQNYIGYAHSRLSQLGPAMGHFQRALILNPRHRAARAHLGELFLVLGEPLKANEQLAALRQICLIPCEETSRLASAIAAEMKRYR